MIAERAHGYVEQLASIIELAGAAIILGVIILASGWFVTQGRRSRNWRAA
jgi:hypothetical protein